MSEKRGVKYEEEMELRRGPWTLEEDSLLVQYIACHGEGRWNLLARCSGLKRTGKSCRLRWLNYLKPDVKRGNLSPEEQYLILELHSKWGNRWSRIAQYLPGRTDNEIKNYWRTRVQKQARQLKIDVNSTMFREAIHCYWMPRLLEKMNSSSSLLSQDSDTTATTTATNNVTASLNQATNTTPLEFFNPGMQAVFQNSSCYDLSGSENCSPTMSSTSVSTALNQLPKISELSSNPTENFSDLSFNQLLNGQTINNNYDLDPVDLASASATTSSDWMVSENNGTGNAADSLWALDELWYIRKLHGWGGI